MFISITSSLCDTKHPPFIKIFIKIRVKLSHIYIVLKRKVYLSHIYIIYTFVGVLMMVNPFAFIIRFCTQIVLSLYPYNILINIQLFPSSYTCVGCWHFATPHCTIAVCWVLGLLGWPAGGQQQSHTITAVFSWKETLFCTTFGSASWQLTLMCVKLLCYFWYFNTQLY